MTRQPELSKIVLVDMDGTITPARQPIESDMVDALVRLSSYAKIAIVTGSGIDYTLQQCRKLLKGGYDFSNFIILPCNGTQKYLYIDGEWKQNTALNMREHIGEDCFRQLMLRLSERLYATHIRHYPHLPLTGHFVAYRGSLINWCPIGRLAEEKDRVAFMEYEKKFMVRYQVIDELKKDEYDCDLSFALGGHTSIDIYPVGWDKTFALTHFPDHECWFIGDRCTVADGNDKPLYDKIASTHPNRAFEVKNTLETLDVINYLIEDYNAE